MVKGQVTYRNLYDILSFPSERVIDNNNLSKRNNIYGLENYF